MSKFVADKISRTFDEDNNKLIISFAVSGFHKPSANLTVEENRQFDELEVDVKQYKSKRSKDQNAMLWSLLTKIAIHISGSKEKLVVEQIYCDMLEEANAHYEYLLAPKNTEEGLRKSFRAVREVGTRKVGDKELIMYKVFVGSSKYDTKEMTDLIDTVIRRCDELGIKDSEIEVIRNS